jgi:ABC-2 type transport system permease protein
MANMSQAIWVEVLKARRSRMPLFTALGFLVFPLALGFFMVVLKYPEFARRYWLVSAKAQIMIGVADWPTYLRFLALASTMGGFFLFSLIASWVFGREDADHTMRDLLALPTPRSTIVLAKFIVFAIWSAALALLNCVIALGVGATIGLGQASLQSILEGGVGAAAAACLAMVVATPIAFAASAGHGYLPPIGIALLGVFLAQVTGQAGWGEYFPWAIPAIYAQGGNLSGVSWAIVILTTIAGVLATVHWWGMADHTR